jgi:membrane-bound hydrogenase subunit beta
VSILARDDNEYFVSIRRDGELMSMTSLTSPLSFKDVAEQMNSFGTPEQVRRNRIRISTTPDLIRDAIRTAQESLSCDHLITISTADIGDMFELQYHLTGPHRMIISFVLTLRRDKPETPSTYDLLAATGIYERQIHDLFGIVFPGHPDLKRIILCEDWPENEYPMRKDWKPQVDTGNSAMKKGGV